MGSADIYAALADCPEVTDSLVVGVELPDAGYYLPMFVQLRGGEQLDAELKASIRARIRARRFTAPRSGRHHRRPRHPADQDR